MVEDFDFIVAGAGMAGASVAAELAAAGRRVAVLELEEQPGYHATGRSAALHSEIYGNATIRALSRASRSFFSNGIDGGASFATPRGFLLIATGTQLDRLGEFAQKPDVRVATEWLSAPDACRAVGVLRKDYIAGALIERNAYDLDVEAIHQFYLRSLKAGGGALLCSQPLRDVQRSAAGLWIVGTGSRQLRAPTLINAAGAWGDIVARLVGAQEVGLEPRRRTALLVEAPSGSAIADWPVVFDVDEQFYFKPDAGRILISPADETPSEPCDAFPLELDVALAVDRVQAAADIPVKRVLHSWAGLRTFAPDGAPVVGYDPAIEGFFWLVGQGGYGIQTAPALARLASSLALSGTAPAEIVDHGLILEDISPDRPQSKALEMA